MIIMMIITVSISIICAMVAIFIYYYSKLTIMRTNIMNHHFERINIHFDMIADMVAKYNNGDANSDDDLDKIKSEHISIANDLEFLALCYYDGRFYNKKIALEMFNKIFISYYECESIQEVFNNRKEKYGDTDIGYEYFERAYRESKKHEKRKAK